MSLDNQTMPPAEEETQEKDWKDKLLDSFFELTHRGAQRRRALRFWLFILLWLGLAWFNWGGTLRQDLSNFFTSLLTMQPDLLTNLAVILEHFIAPPVLRVLLIVIFGYWLAFQAAYLFVADIFEKNEDVGREFIKQAAFASRYSVINVSKGKIHPAYEDSPILLIGGPGELQVELDSAVLVEGPDGNRVIGPTGREPHGRARLNGFERIRQCVDLRDQHNSQTVVARSRDGILIAARDIRYMFSIARGPHIPSHANPYPFDEDAVRKQIYTQTRNAGKPGAEPDWKKPLPAQIFSQVHRHLGGFISSNNIGEFLANIGEPEMARMDEAEETIAETSSRIAGGGETASTLRLEPGKFIPRSNISNLFQDVTFAKVQQQKGFQLHWIGVGTWDTPDTGILENHLQAWMLSRDNALRGNQQKLQELEDDARMQELLRLIQEVLAAFQSTIEKNAETGQVVDEMLGEFHEQLKLALDLYQRDGQEPSLELLDAIRVINEIRGFTDHWVGV
jgi:hypothetical protein